MKTMKASELIKLLQQRIKEYDDLEVCVYQQTGADSWLMQPVTGAVFQLMLRNKRILELTTE